MCENPRENFALINEFEPHIVSPFHMYMHCSHKNNLNKIYFHWIKILYENNAVLTLHI